MDRIGEERDREMRDRGSEVVMDLGTFVCSHLLYVYLLCDFFPTVASYTAVAIHND